MGQLTMARKANIAREEIDQACWDLIENNRFPNIPRLTEYFLQKDGRRCSNTTFMNAIAEWEESYKEHQQHQLKELDSVLLPLFKRFSRDVTQHLGQLLDEKSTEIEQHQQRKLDATEGGYLALSGVLIDLQTAHDQLTKTHKRASNDLEQLQIKLLNKEQQYQDILTQNNVLTSQLKQEQKISAELQINLAQQQVNLAKQDNQIALLMKENGKLNAELDSIKTNSALSDQKRWHEMTEKLEALTTSVKSIQHKDRGSKQ